MKTLLGAVIQFKGTKPHNMEFIIDKKGLFGNNNGYYVASFFHDGFKVICTLEEFNATVDEMATNYGTSETYYDYKANYTAINNDMKPVTSPTYTKAMADEGVLPSVGMECMVGDSAYSEEYFKGVISFVGTSNVVWVHGGTEYSQNKSHLEFKPLTPPIELIDGKAYQFDYHNGSSGMNNAVMRYNKFIGKFQFDNHYFNPVHCTNIQLLEVK